MSYRKPLNCKLNIHHTVPKSLGAMDELGLSQNTKEPTRPVSGKILDLVIINYPSSVNKTSLLVTDFYLFGSTAEITSTNNLMS